jgi:hypothetical protein
MNTNGQIKANANCSCMVTMIPVTVNNNSGQNMFPITFPGVAPYSVNTGTHTINVPENMNYSSVQVGPFGSFMFDFIMGTRPHQNNVNYGTFTGVNITPGSSDLTITINIP